MWNSDKYEDALEQRLAVLGTRTPQCQVDDCQETNPFALTGTDPDIVCYEHGSPASGQSIVEQQHTAARANSPANFTMLGNDHRVADSYKVDWPQATLRNVDGSPLLRWSAMLRGWLDLLRVVIDRTVGQIPAALEKLNDWLIATHGPRWWDDVDLGFLT